MPLYQNHWFQQVIYRWWRSRMCCSFTSGHQHDFIQFTHSLLVEGSLTPHWSLCSNTAPELNRHPLKHCISARGQEHTHAHRVSIYLIFNVKSMLRRSFCLLQLLEKKDVQYPQLAISDISKIRWGKSVWESPSYDHLNNFPLQSSWLFLDSLLFFWNISEFSHVLHGTQMHSKNQPSYVWHQSFYFFPL